MSDSKDVYLKQLVKQYGNTTAVNGINLDIPAGSYCCLVGPSGCGKTSTLRMISGHEDITKGSITIGCLLYTSPSPRDGLLSRMPSSA